MTKQTLSNISIILAILLGLGLFIVTVGGAAGEAPWPGATNPTPLTQRNDLRERSAIAVAPGLNGNVSVAWASERSGGITLTRQVNGSWAESQTVALDVTGEAGWNPRLVYSGTDILATWVQGKSAGGDPNTVIQQVLNQELATINTQTIITQVYGFIAPDVAIGPTGIHLVFSASSDPIVSKWDLYYAHRPLTTPTWSTPTVVLTSSAVITPGISSQIRDPKLALDQEGAGLHIVWQQDTRQDRSRRIWYIHGTWDATEITWNAPQRVSPLEHNAILPNITVDQEDQVHISWSEFIGAYTEADAQYINYQRGAPDQGHSPYRLHNQVLQVNNNFPTNTEAAISARGERICIAWYGFYGPEGYLGKEEIWMRCSPDSGLSWQGEINVAQSSDLLSAHAQVTLDSQGQAHLIWGEFLIEGSETQPEGLYYRTGTAELDRVFLPVIMREQ